MEFNVRHREDVIILNPSREIIGPASREFRNVVAEQLARVSETPKFLFDFANVSIMDSTALGVLMGTHLTITPQSGRLGLINSGTKIKTLIAKSKLSAVFEHFENEDEAIAALTTD